jgi:hypothetical protein
MAAWSSRGKLRRRPAGRVVVKSRDRADGGRYSYARTQTVLPPLTMVFQLDLSAKLIGSPSIVNTKLT